MCKEAYTYEVIQNCYKINWSMQKINDNLNLSKATDKNFWKIKLFHVIYDLTYKWQKYIRLTYEYKINRIAIE